MAMKTRMCTCCGFGEMHYVRAATTTLIPHRLCFIDASTLILPSPLLHWRFRLMAGITHAALASRSSPPSLVQARFFSSRSSFACTLSHRHRIPEAIDELTGPYNSRNHSILGLPSLIEVTFYIGQSLKFE
jgi:hypothetical protein